MIPKKIHYCWFGNGKKSRSIKKCIKSWRALCPEYEIIEWNENNFDVNMNEYTKYCFENKKWAFLSDYARLYVVYEHGGIYLDTDVELVKKPDDLLNSSAFFGFQHKDSSEWLVNTGLGFGSVAKGEALQAMLNEYDVRFSNGVSSLCACPSLNTKALLKFGLTQNGECQNLCCADIYSTEYFCPFNPIYGRLCKTKNTISIHWYSATWMSMRKRIRFRIGRYYHRIFGANLNEAEKSSE